MADQPVSHDFVYVHTDIPPGMTIREWRAQRAAERGAAGAPTEADAGLVARTVAIVDVWLHARRPRRHATAREVRA